MSVTVHPAESLIADEKTRRFHERSLVFDGLAIGYVLDEKYTQGASMMESSDQFWRLETMVRMGLHFLGLAYTTANLFGDGCGEHRDAGRPARPP